MKLSHVIPFFGLAAGAATGWLSRGEDTAVPTAKQSKSSAVASAGETNHSRKAASSAAAVSNLKELRALWGDDGAAGIYEQLEGVPAAQLAEWLEEYLPPDVRSYKVERRVREGICQALVERLSESDPAALAAWLRKVPHGYLDYGWMVGAVEGLLNQNSADSAGVLAKLEATHPIAGRIKAEWLAKRDPDAALQLFVSRQDLTMPDGLKAWLAGDPARAKQFAKDHPGRAYPVMAALGDRSLSELQAFVADLKDPADLRYAQPLLLMAAAKEGNAAVFVDLFSRLGVNPIYNSHDDAMLHLVRHHPEAAQTVLHNLENRPALWGRMLGMLAVTQPEQAAALLTSPSAAEFWKTGGNPHDIMRSLNLWAASEPAAAQSWLLALPEELRSKVVPLAWEMAADLPNDDWFSLTGGSRLSGRGLARQALQRSTDPEVLAAWCASFPDRNSRELLLRELRENMKTPQAAENIAARVKEIRKTPPP
ncbi:MAG TPA: hypothetical protein VG796_24290 [Verrucomicrobiales bacterium]|nr:hypothetical protein [Verrucomicrobiales bacterium]